MPPPTDTSRFETAKALFLQGVSRHEAGRHAQAEAAFQASLEALPGRASTLMNLGAAQLALGKPAQALQALEASLKAEPDAVQALCHQAQALSALGRPLEAMSSIARARALAPELPAARYLHAQLLAAAGRAREAVQTLQPLLQPYAEAAATWLLAGQALQSLGQRAEALKHYEQALALNPQLPRVHAVLGQALAEAGEISRARAVWSQGVAAGVETALNSYLLAGLGEAPAPGHSPPDYVHALFDAYAEGFDAHLVDTLQYRGHLEVVRAAVMALGAPWRDSHSAAPVNPPLERPHVQRVLDLGCGTGLCGRSLRQQLEVGHLEGIDLSTTMVRAAQDSGAYDTVTPGDIVDTLRSSPRQADLVLAADVFIYLGDLQPVFDALRGVLVPGGWLCFSVEPLSDAEAAAHLEGWCLRPSLRYAQSPAYLQRLCAGNGWRWGGWQAFDLRLEQGQPLAGAVVWMQAPT